MVFNQAVSLLNSTRKKASIRRKKWKHCEVIKQGNCLVMVDGLTSGLYPEEYIPTIKDILAEDWFISFTAK